MNVDEYAARLVAHAEQIMVAETCRIYGLDPKDAMPCRQATQAGVAEVLLSVAALLREKHTEPHSGGWNAAGTLADLARAVDAASWQAWVDATADQIVTEARKVLGPQDQAPPEQGDRPYCPALGGPCPGDQHGHGCLKPCSATPPGPHPRGVHFECPHNGPCLVYPEARHEMNGGIAGGH